jgi:crotonobetainyl-CoA:carnitine CoA-transferase CaiB-like acyl-CoA transferase
MAPHDAYRVAGSDRWITIAVASDEEFAALAKVLGKAELARDSRFATVASRKENEAALDAVISDVTKEQDPAALERALQSAGVKACRVVKPYLLVEDEGLRHIGFFQLLSREVTGGHPFKRWPFRFSSIDASHRRPPPLLGEHNGEVLTALLGLSQEELARLERERVIGTAPLGLAG